jgi:hypothetical protein
MWRLPRTSDYSYLRVAAIRIDVHPAGENPINTTHTLPTPVHVHPSYASYGQFLYVATFHESSIDLYGSHCSWEKGLLTQSIARRLTDPWVHTQFLYQVHQWSSRPKPNFCWWQATRLTGPISPACDWHVQYLLAGANPSVLNQHRRGLQPCRCRLVNTTPWPSQPTVLHFPPNGPARSQVIHQLITIWTKGRPGPKSRLPP